MYKKLAMSFHRTTGVEVEELEQEAVLAGLEAELSYNTKTSNVATLVTYKTTIIKNRLINFCQKQSPKYCRFYEVKTKTLTTPEQIVLWKDEYANLPKDAKWLADEIIAKPEFDLQNKSKSRAGIRQYLLTEKKWSHKRTWDAMRDLKTFVGEN